MYRVQVQNFIREARKIMAKTTHYSIPLHEYDLLYKPRPSTNIDDRANGSGVCYKTVKGFKIIINPGKVRKPPVLFPTK